MATVQIVKGDYGRPYRFTTSTDVDLSDCTAKLTVWNKLTGTVIISEKDCNNPPVYDNPYTHIDYTPADGDFDVDPGAYRAIIEFTKTGVVEHTLPFTWEVFTSKP